MPYPDRTVEEWKGELTQDMKLISMYVLNALDADQEGGDDGWGNPLHHRAWAMALKEARRLQSDLYRMAEKAGVSREEIDKVGPL
jgi:hypothetical protein